MITKNEIKTIKSLSEKKNRIELNQFIVEGEKSILELLGSDFEVEKIFCTKEFSNKHSKILSSILIEVIDQETLEKISTFKTNDSAVALVKQAKLDLAKLEQEQKIIALDDIKDPGNLGTIIRICDWYGIENIIASENTVDFYNPKVISASMGSFSRVNVFYLNLKDFLLKQNKPIFGAFLEGEDLHKTIIPDNAIVVMGSESHGISKELEEIIKNKITIPSKGKAESLNAAVATAIIVDNWTRNN